MLSDEPFFLKNGMKSGKPRGGIEVKSLLIKQKIIAKIFA